MLTTVEQAHNVTSYPKDAQGQKTTLRTKPKLGRSTNKEPKPVRAKPKLKPSPSPQAQTSITQVGHDDYHQGCNGACICTVMVWYTCLGRVKETRTVNLLLIGKNRRHLEVDTHLI